MSMTDPIADMLTRIRNANMVKHQKVDIPSSTMKVNIASVLKQEGFIKNYKVISDNLQGVLRVYLKYIDEKDCVINEIRRISKPGGRVYVKSDDIPVIKSGLGIAILSTSKGIVTDNVARKSGLGGEIICTVGKQEIKEHEAMSRIGKLPIEITKGVKLDYNVPVLTVQGPNGILSRQIMSCVTLDITDTTVTVSRNDENNTTRAAHGLTRTLINNMVVGVTKGFQTNLEINGVGYRAEVKGKELVLSLGYSHPVNFQIPEGIVIEVEKMTKMSVRGFDKELVGQTAAKIRSFRPPEPYKGKGIKYADETILRKAGKTGKK